MNDCTPIVCNASVSVTLNNSLHLSKQLSPIALTPPSETVYKRGQFSNALASRIVELSSLMNVTFSRPKQFSNALFATVLTFWIVILLIELHPVNAYLPITVKFFNDGTLRFTHFSNAYYDDNYTKTQFDRFIKCIETLKMNEIETGTVFTFVEVVEKNLLTLPV